MQVAQKTAANNHTASTSDSSKQMQRELVPSFLKALYITSEDTIFDDDCVSGIGMLVGHSQGTLGLKSFTNSAEGALSAPDVHKMRMQDVRSKSALAPTSNTKTAVSADETTNGLSLHQNFVD